MKPVFSFLLIFSVSLLLIACGYQSSDEDKYPEMPIFPSTDNLNIKLTKIPDLNYIYNIDDIFFRTDNSYLYYFKNNCYTKKDSIKIYNSNLITQSGMLYSTDYEDEKAFKIDIKTGKKTKLSYHPFNPSEEYDRLIKKLEDKELGREIDIDDVLKFKNKSIREDKVSTQIADKFSQTIFSGLQQVTLIPISGQYYEKLYILKYNDREVIFKGIKYLSNENGQLINPETIFSEYEGYNEMEQYLFKKIDILSQCDKVVTGNTLSSPQGRRFVPFFYFTPKGYTYYQLQFDGEIIYFKSNFYSTLEAVLLPDNKTTILGSVYYSNGKKINNNNYVLSRENN